MFVPWLVAFVPGDLRADTWSHLYPRLLVSISGEYVVFDLETNADRPETAEHEIIQVGAVAASAAGEVDSFESLVRPQRRLPQRITELTGLEYGELAGAPPPEHVLAEFFDWVGNRPMIAHNGFGYDFPVLEAAAAAADLDVPAGSRLDTLELAHVVFPRAGSPIPGVDGISPPVGRSLDELAHLYGVAARDRHDALNDSRMTRSIMVGLLEDLDRTTPARRLQRWVLGVAGHPWSRFLAPETDPPSLADVVPPAAGGARSQPTGRFDIGTVVRWFQSGGRLMTGARTPRSQQAEMAGLVARALSSSGSRWMIEAPTGTGKTLAYLVPAIEMARASGRTSVITPHSRVLQDQILATLEELKEEIGPFSTVVLKGRQNYISLNALDAELAGLEGESQRNPALNPVALSLAIISGWVSETPTGDWADLRTAAVAARLRPLRFFRWKLRVDTRPGLILTPLDALDFHRRALQALKTAHVAVLNHALLATGPELEENRFNLVIDEAHGLEDSATAAATLEVSREQLEQLCDALWDSRVRRGLAVRLATATGAGIGDPRIDRIRTATAAARASIERFSTPLTDYLRDRTGVSREQAVRYGAAYRIRRGVDTRHAAYREVLRTGGAMRSALREVIGALDGITVPENPAGRYRRDALEDEIYRLVREVRDANQLVDSVLRAAGQLRLFDDHLAEHELVEWINVAEVSFEATDGGVPEDDLDGAAASIPPGRWRWSLRRAPLSVAGLLADLWDRAHAVVLTSATLRSGDDFGYLIGRLGLGNTESRVIGTPFERLSEQHLLLLTDYLPAPRGGLMDRFTEIEATEIPRLFVAADGGGMALMTARARLDYVRDHSRSHLAPVGIELLAQGDASSPALVERMRGNQPACLLGLRSFWEGVDIPGDALRLLLIEKVPFDSIGDPVVSARTEFLELAGRDPFAEYMVPRAAIAFAQGVGRLIRREDDRGATVVLDNRLRRPVPYRDVLLRSLSGPPARRDVDTPGEAYAAITDHLDIALDSDRWERIGRIPGVETLSRAALRVDAHDLSDGEVIDRVLETARQWLGFDKWRPGQRTIMTRFMRGEDTVAVLPTGSGKSVTYQIPALVSPGVTLVVSPLIALMRDQVDNLRARGVTEAAAIYAGVGQAEQEAILRAAAGGHIKLLYVSPERLWSPLFRAWLAGVDVARVAVDEAHCISMWGHSFRPEYAMIPRAIAEVTGGRLPVLAVTATATSQVLQDIAELMGVSAEPLVGSVNRPEIRYYVERCSNRRDRELRVAQVVEAFRNKSAIVYVPRVRDTTRLSGLLRTFGHRVRPYNGEMEYPERQHTEDAFRHGEIDVVVATKAFGLGIDKPDIALIVHLEMPASIEEYVQETGRVARGAADGSGPETGAAVLLVTPRDCGIHDFFVKSSVPRLDDIRREWNGLDVGMNYIDPGSEGSAAGDAGGNPDQARALALHYLDQVGALRRHRDFVLRGRISVLEDTEGQMGDLRLRRPDLARRAESIVGDMAAGSRDYHGLRASQRLDVEPPEIEAVLFELQKRSVCGFAGWRYGWSFERRAGSEPDWHLLRSLIRRRRETMGERARRARRLAHGFPECRRREMLRYLGEPDPAFEVCGGCDACTPDLPRPWERIDIRASDVREAIQETALLTILVLVDDMERGQFSRLNLIRALQGDGGGPHPLPRQLLLHGGFDRLGMLERRQVEELVDDAIRDGRIEEVEVAYDGRVYTSLRLTAAGRELLTGRYAQ
ncbi:MAG: RecQ family ATP-dependent DNA helicase [bacterium]|nr:RecQ family ATP-dependent DNA helicase [bacterium]